MASSEMKRCARCNHLAFVEKHHVWPKSVFRGLGPIEELCPSCHSEYHIKLGRKKMANPDAKYHENTYDYWYHTGIILLVLIGVGFFFY